jgi:hypothetical protein|tara:strand:- start:168 stop:923 length:756 start_codon:yes stop_codon:yes gene_type:complete
MSGKICVIKQPAGIGDIFFCQKIAQSVLTETDCVKVIWPVASTYSYLNDYMIADNVEFVDETSDFAYKSVYNSNSIYMVDTEQFLFVPLQTADYVQKTSKRHNNPLGHGHMKYDFCGVDYDDWKEYFNFSRNEERENALIEKIGLDITKPYNLINNNCGTYPNFGKREDIKTNNEYPNVYMDFYEGVTLFDWVKIFENAEEIHTVETSVYYILEKLNLEKVYIYAKPTPENRANDFSYMKEHCSNKWTYIN